MPGPTPVEKRRLFQGHALFGKLPQEDLDALLLHARVERYGGGREIFAKGSPGRSMMAILSGSVRISAPSPAGPDIVLAILHAGEVFGEIALLDGEDRTADARAITDCDLLVLDHRDFVPFLERRADLCILFLKLLCQRLRQTDRQVEEAMFGRLDGRIAKALVRLAKAGPPPGTASSNCASPSRSSPAWSAPPARASTSSSRYGKPPACCSSASASSSSPMSTPSRRCHKLLPG